MGITLANYPYVVLRLACNRCPRQGAYRIVRLAVRFGADAEIDAVLDALAADCPKRAPGANIYNRCGAHFPDLVRAYAEGVHPLDPARSARTGAA